MKKKKIIIGNWKMNPLSAKEAAKIFSSIKKTASRLKKTETIICPPFIYLENLSGKKENARSAPKIPFGKKGARLPAKFLR